MILDDMKSEIVFTGGSIITLLVTDPAAPAMRETFDVDIYVQRSSVPRHYRAEA